MEASANEMSKSVDDLVQIQKKRSREKVDKFMRDLQNTDSDDVPDKEYTNRLRNENRLSTPEKHGNSEIGNESDDFTQMKLEEDKEETSSSNPDAEKKTPIKSDIQDLYSGDARRQNFYYYQVDVHITNNTNKEIFVRPGIDFGCNGLASVPIRLCCDNGVWNNLPENLYDSKFYNNGIVKPGGKGWSWNFWCINPITESIDWSFNYDVLEVQDVMKIEAKDGKVSAHFHAGPDGKPTVISKSGVKPIGKILFDKAGVIFSYKLKLIKEYPQCYTAGSHECKRCRPGSR